MSHRYTSQLVLGLLVYYATFCIEKPWSFVPARGPALQPQTHRLLHVATPASTPNFLAVSFIAVPFCMVACQRKAKVVASRSSGVHRQAEASDTVTGTKFEEDDKEKNPQGRGGHQVKGMQEVDPETAAKQAIVREQQQNCPRLSWAEEMRTILAQQKGFATLSTVAQKGSIEGFPTGSIVGFAVDEKGRPIFVFSSMSTHTKNLQKDARASLCVTESSFQGAADARVVLTGEVRRVPKGEDEDLRKRYMDSHPNAYWAMFGDFAVYRMDDILDVAFVGGFARAGGVTPEEYCAAEVDPCVAFAEPVMAHMNNDHESATIAYVQYLVGSGKEVRGVKSAKMKSLDKLGFNVRVVQEGGEGVLRIPFPEPVTERKNIKLAIMEMSKKCAEIAEAEAAKTKAAESEEPNM
mmetsp:Transcript_54701/g.97585  ORF Transcript_54701/g.97585 Transcript_54701/m.97585 type:complete len:408 (-) Transcript_54701:166-1389(-)|eukprot:CAMPEP_0197622640 /NCGR_PEP_ID=MMETSP1338-20131121/2858_1 /TAXON_ID=43686 ORGANISM="Pelagodinium beii, Strain RCC1491" /NCGR_SAMPLE_ID=MMETSP1338 /ASSEMBLY_ACC=CAM_ASM_000754 /LENGTH=407 /DNA_ID=CAMNT_0043192387 /DNA_START=50 /DNA_END=1273 /DNA_ORIENTATION=-